jgi:hypothetical protein
MSFITLAPRLTVLDIPYFADVYSRTRASYRLTQRLRPIPRAQSVMIQLYNTAQVQIIPAQVYSLAELSKVLSTILITQLASPTLYAC